MITRLSLPLVMNVPNRLSCPYGRRSYRASFSTVGHTLLHACLKNETTGLVQIMRAQTCALFDKYHTKQKKKNMVETD